MGGYQQPQIDAQTIASAFALGVDPGAAVAAPRFVVDDLPEDGGVPRVDGRGGRPEPRPSPRSRRPGFAVRRLDDLDGEVGHAHLIARHADGRLHAGLGPARATAARSPTEGPTPSDGSPGPSRLRDWRACPIRR